MGNQGDLGRRIAERRRELGLSLEEAAQRSGMDPTYLSSLEARSQPVISSTAFRHLATALETTVEALGGGGTQLPPGHGTPVGHLDLVALDPDECRRLIAEGGIGRVVFADDGASVALPVNFRTVDGDIVFRTNSAGPIAAAFPAELITFEVDHIDDALTEGWSVLVRGPGWVVTEPAERRSVEGLDIEPWSGGVHDAYVRIAAHSASGRRIRHAPG